MSFRGSHTTIASDARVGQFTGQAVYAFDRGTVRGRRTEAAVDEAGAESFPASDPPPWTPGVARPLPLRSGPDSAGAGAKEDAEELDDDVNIVRWLREAAASLAGAIGVVLLVPIAILIVGLPVALAVRGVAAMVSWIWAALG